MFQANLLDAAARELQQLDNKIRRQIVKKLNWLAANVEETKLESLGGDFEGLFKLRVGDYRIIFEVLTKEKTLLVHLIGHRKEVYRKKK